MVTEADPIVSTWYKHLDKGQDFQVVAVDENDLVVEIQYFDGDVEEIDLDDWYLMDLEQIESPEDISGALDVSEPDDLGPAITDAGSGDWDSSIQELKGYDDQDFSGDIIDEDSMEEEDYYEETWD